MNYVVIIPAYNEAEFVGRTLDSLCSQQLRPALLIVVDDGSSDATPEIVRQYAEGHSWIQLVQKEKSERAVGSKVVLAFNTGYESIPSELDYGFIVKLDADLELPPDYFEQVSNMFSKYDDCGICGGYCVIPDGDRWIREKTAPMHIRGAFKAIRKKAFEEIGGFRPIMGWDGVDQTKLLSRGWKIGLIDLPVKHFRPTGQASDTKKLYSKWGEVSFCKGAGFILAGMSGISLMRRTKSVVALFSYMKGFVLAGISNKERVLSGEERRFFRKLQYKRIFSEKKVIEQYAHQK